MSTYRVHDIFEARTIIKNFVLQRFVSRKRVSSLILVVLLMCDMLLFFIPVHVIFLNETMENKPTCQVHSWRDSRTCILTLPMSTMRSALLSRWKRTQCVPRGKQVRTQGVPPPIVHSTISNNFPM